MNGTPQPRGKPLPSRPMPSRPSQDRGYNNVGGSNGSDYGAPAMNGRVGPQAPNDTLVLDGYRQDIMTGFEGEKPRYNPMNTARPQSSMLLNINDTIQVHLLVETALGDSREFEILSQEEVDELKKQVQSLTQRIEQARQNLIIQSKYRDAAISMSRLYSPTNANGEGRRRSIFGHNRSSSDQSKEAEQERQASERKCEDLAAELWGLEKRVMEPQSRLLRHTAGILQMTHKGPKKTSKGAAGSMQPGIPGSPESMYTYHNARNSMEPISDENFFDERSLYRSADAFEEIGGDGWGSGGKGSSEQMRIINSAEQKLEELNSKLREVLVKSNPDTEASYGPPPLTTTPRGDKSSEPGESLQNHLDYLEKSIATFDQERGPTSGGEQEQTEAVLTGLWDIIQSGEEENKQRKLERRKTRSSQNLPPDEDDSADEDGNLNGPYSLQAFSTKVQFLYTQATRLKDQKKVLQRQIKQQRELNNKSDATKDAELQGKVEELERTQSLLTRTEKDADSVRQQLSAVMDKLDEARQQEQLRNQSREQDESAAIREAQDDLNRANARILDLEEELEELKDDNSIGTAEMQARIGDAEAKIASLTQELAAAAEAQKAFDQSLKDKDQEIEAKEKAMEETNMDLARLQTEVTIAKAELDGAYGSRAQRAAEVASNPAIQREFDELNQKNNILTAEIAQLKAKSSGDGDGGEKVKTLKKELEETIEEYEQMTKASIEWEKEREMLEGSIDKLRDERETLEAQLSDEKVRWLGMKSPGGDGSSGGTTSTTVLKNEFKKMMRDTRAENQKTLRAEQTERRKLEDELRALKRQQGHGKSSLSQSIGS